MAQVVNVKRGTKNNSLTIWMIPKIELLTKIDENDLNKENTFVCIAYVYINDVIIGNDITFSKFNLEEINLQVLSKSDFENIKLDCRPRRIKIIEGDLIFIKDIFKIIEKKRERNQGVRVNAYVKLLYIGNDGKFRMVDSTNPVKSEDYVISSLDWISMMKSMDYYTLKMRYEFFCLSFYTKLKRSWKIFQKFNNHIKKYKEGYRSIIIIIGILVILFMFITGKITIYDIIKRIVNYTLKP